MKYTHNILGPTQRPLDIYLFLKQLELPVQLDYIAEDAEGTLYYLYREGVSVSDFELIDHNNNFYEISRVGKSTESESTLVLPLVPVLNA